MQSERMGMKHRFRLVVFDWDGTLLNSEARIVECLRIAGEETGLPPLPDKTLSNVIGLGLREAIMTLYPAAAAEEHVHFVDCYRHHYVYASQTPTPLFEGVRELLDDLGRRGAYLAIATGKARRGLDRALVEHGFENTFHATRCADEAFSKPHPQMLLDIMEYLGVEPEETLMIGDTEYDIVMAQSAGVATVGVSYGVHGRERLLQLKPLACVDSLTELSAWFDACEFADAGEAFQITALARNSTS